MKFFKFYDIFFYEYTTNEYFLSETQFLIILFSLYLLMNLDPGHHILWYSILLGHDGVTSMLLFWSVHYRGFTEMLSKYLVMKSLDDFRVMVITVEKLELVWGCF